MSAAVADRGRLRHLALLLAIITGGGLVGLASSPLHLFSASALMVMTLLTLGRPSLLPVLIVGGQLTAAAVLLGLDGTGRWMLLPVVMSLVGTAELIGALMRLDGPLPRAPAAGLRRAARSATVGGAVYAAVLLWGDPPGLGGAVGATLVLGACMLLAWVVFRDE